ncbi:hypothetical protein IU438_28765 [Nocardia cyriacigeorgica]|uniref:hypothetical protein n=1 Tax=Nocardia cyriacigeorgica TaxID=135487 RepID=UPI0018938C10|nr:hypothetical protein [Nocardia cyriacigeorgica]MBF6399765.1 hypothetical protein [Nocardia cyriacigeorgica]MBF6405406.1 hypothetical protein [Nocardia cyriacigeorgica]
MSKPECARCSRPVGDSAPLCRTCGQSIVDALLRVPALLDELTVTRAGLGRNAPPTANRSRGGEVPLPVRAAGSLIEPTPFGAAMVGDYELAAINNVIGTWARLLAETLAVDPYLGGAALVAATDARRGPHTDDRTGAALPATAPSVVAQAAVWLAGHRHALRAHEAAPELLRDIIRAVDALERLVDRPVERRYLGACPAELADGTVCGYELRTEIDENGRPQTWVRCARASCRTQYEVAAIETKARKLAEQQLYTLADLVRLTAAIGAPVPKPTLYRWAKERRIEPRGWQHTDDRGVRITDYQITPGDPQVYRLGDVLAYAARNTRGSAA